MRWIRRLHSDLRRGKDRTLQIYGQTDFTACREDHALRDNERETEKREIPARYPVNRPLQEDLGLWWVLHIKTQL